MEVLNLATKEKQDEILSSFNSSEIYKDTRWVTVATHGSNDLINIAGKGKLIGLDSQHTTGVSSVYVQLDGGIIYEVKIPNPSIHILMASFNNSLRISYNNTLYVHTSYTLS